MTKDLIFRLRLDAQDRERLDVVAAHFSAPAATAVRILIKERYDAVMDAQAARRQRDMEVIALGAPANREAPPRTKTRAARTKAKR